ncbi:MAG TPA: hypothetical protein VHO25_12160 [Polyangiaceae bacterium]|nr:hypothetical protein [Polyangiaceae bacterium]
MRTTNSLLYCLLLAALAQLPTACEDSLALSSTPPPPDAASDAASNDAASEDAAQDAGATNAEGGARDSGVVHLVEAGIDEPDACVLGRNDPKHCGCAGEQCAAGAGCEDGMCREPPREYAWTTHCGPIRLTVDDTNVYWTERDSGFVRAVKVGGGPVMDIAQLQINPAHIVSDAEGVYWVARGDFASEHTWIRKLALPLAPSTPREMVNEWNSYGPIMSLAVHGGSLYYGWLHQVRRVDMDDPDLTRVTVARMADGQGFAEGLIIEDARGIWQDSDGRLVTGTLDPSDPTNLTDIGRVPTSLRDEIAYDADWLYWIKATTVQRSKLDGTRYEAEHVVTHPNQESITGLAMDDTHIYFASSQGLILKHSREPAAQSEPLSAYPVIAREQPAARSLAVRDGRLYWATEDCAIRSASVE